MEKQGIVSILGSDYSQGTKTAAASFRRNLSADMSSKKWLAQNGFKSPLMKKIASSEQLSIISLLDSSSSSEEAEEFDGKKLGQIRKQDDVWSSIISQNKTQELPPPYVHPLVKKASSSLSEKSLKICTESLGSETGSDGFSSSETGSEADESDKAEELSQSQTQQEKEYLQSSIVPEESRAVAKYNYSAASCKKSVQPRSFPPPLPSLARSSEGPSLHMHSHRQNGRLVLEAVSVLSTKNFHAQRQDGRLRLTLLNTTTTLDQQQVQQLKNDESVILDQKGDKVEEDLEEVFDIFEKEQEENEIEEDEEEEMAEEIEKGVNEPQEMGIVMEQAVPKMARGVINVHRSAFIIKNSMGLENQKPTWTHKFNYTPAKLMQVDAADEEATQLPHSLPPRSRAAWLIPSRPAAVAASLNAYEYFWRTKPVAASLKNPLTHNCLPLKNNTINKVIASNKPKAYEQQQLVALRNCKEARRSLLSWEPYCIATS